MRIKNIYSMAQELLTTMARTWRHMDKPKHGDLELVVRLDIDAPWQVLRVVPNDGGRAWDTLQNQAFAWQCNYEPYRNAQFEVRRHGTSSR